MTAFQIFTEKIRKGIMAYCADTCMVELNEVTKNNGKVYHGITIIKRDCNISPTIYLDDLYQQYTDGVTLSKIMERIIEIYEKYRIDQGLDLHFLTDFALASERVLFKLIGYEKNRALLKELPHIRFLDMAIVFYCSIQHDTLGSMSIPIKNGLCRMWDTDAKELLTLAKNNTPRILQADLMDMKELINAMGEMDIAAEKETVGESLPDGAPSFMEMYVLSNRQKHYGAACIRYPGILRQCAQKAGDDLLILPSSVHEVLLVPKRTGISVDEYKKMVYEINRTQVAWEDILTDSVYYYDREKDIIVQY